MYTVSIYQIIRYRNLWFPISNRMKIAYIVNARMPTEKAHGYQIARMCVAFAEKGAEVELIVPSRANTISEDAFAYYGLSRVFRVRTIGPRFLDSAVDKMPIIGFRLRAVLFLLRLLFLKISEGTLVYSRDPEVVWLFGIRGYKVVYDIHRWPERGGRFFRYLIRRADVVIANSRGTADACDAHGIEHVYVAHNAVDLSTFAALDEKETLRRQLGLPKDKKIVMYVGHLYPWKGVPVVLDAARALLGRTDIVFVFVGGMQSDVEKYRRVVLERRLANVLLLGHKKKEIIPKFLAAADVLLLPNVPTTKESISYTSPIKMFEYMASGIPIISSDLPSLHEILNERNSALFEAGNHIALAGAITEIFIDPQRGRSISQKALADVFSFTWENRADSILGHIKQYVDI